MKDIKNFQELLRDHFIDYYYFDVTRPNYLLKRTYMSKYKENQELIADDMGYWGPKYNHTTVKITRVQDPLYTVEAFDGSSFTVHKDNLIESEEFYSQASGRAGFELPDLPAEKECDCDITSFF